MAEDFEFDIGGDAIDIMDSIEAKGGIDADIQNEMNKYSDDLKKSTGNPGVLELKLEFNSDSKVLELKDVNGNEIKLDGKSYGDFLKDPESDFEKGAKDLVKAQGLTGNAADGIADDYRRGWEESPKIADAQLETELKNMQDEIQKNDPGLKEKLNDPNATPDDINKAIDDSKTVKDLQSKIDEISKDNEKMQKANEELEKKLGKAPDGKTWMDILKLGLAGFLGYNLLKARAYAMEGCWVSYSSQSSVSRCKIPTLTCDTNAQNAGQSNFCPSGFPTDCLKGKTCDSTCADKKGCASSCSCDFRVCQSGQNTYLYKCVKDVSVFDAFSDLVNTISNVVNNAVDTGSDLINNLLKILKQSGKYIILFIIGFVILFLLFKLFSLLRGHKKEEIVLENPQPIPQTIPAVVNNPSKSSAPAVVNNSTKPATRYF
jgi:hypothetical protein